MEKRKYINIFSKKINIQGLSDEALKLLGIWYNGEKYKSKNVNYFDKMNGKRIFEQMLAKTNLFKQNLNIEIIETNKGGFDFICKDKDGNNLFLMFFVGGYIDHAPRIKIVNKDIVTTYYTGFPADGIGGTFIPCIEKEKEESINTKYNQNILNKFNNAFNIKNDELIETNNENIKKDELIEIKNENKKNDINNIITKDFIDKYYENSQETIEENKGLRR